MNATVLPHAPVRAPQFDSALIRKHSLAGPRYTSYPSADRFSDSFGYGDYLQALAGLRLRPRKPLSLYLHIPFCDTVCYYCACNKIVTRNRARAAEYLAYLKREIELQARLLGPANTVAQLHLGGGTPTYLSDQQMGELMAHVRRWFALAPDAPGAGQDAGEFSIEIDPRTVSPERVHSLRRQGFNRLSLGVQDFDDAVQRAVNRIQPEPQTRAIIDAARAAGFHSVSIDLIYGLPRQSPDSMRRTLAKVIAADPDRIAVYHYAHMPQLFKPQRRIAEAELPDASARLALLELCIASLGAAGYVYIGMDHFAKPGDALAVAQRQGRLQRNFQGYSTHADSDLVACGVSAIGAVGATYSQNAKTLEAYYEAIDRNQLPVVRGLCLDFDDLLRRAIIQMLMCHFELSIRAIELAYPVNFAAYFAPELERLGVLAADGLLEIGDQWITVTSRGRLLIRNVCMVFDRHLHRGGPARHSQTV